MGLGNPDATLDLTSSAGNICATQQKVSIVDSLDYNPHIHIIVNNSEALNAERENVVDWKTKRKIKNLTPRNASTQCFSHSFEPMYQV